MKKSTRFIIVAAILGSCLGLIAAAYDSMESQGTAAEMVVVPVTIEIPAECAGQAGDCVVLDPVIVASR